MSGPAIDQSRLEALIRQREEKGGERFAQAKLVALRLGKRTPKKHGTYFRFRQSGLYIDYDNYGANITVYWHGHRVLASQLGDVTMFIPGDWESHLQRLYTPLKVDENLKEVSEKRERLNAQMARWGITPEEVMQPD